MKDIQNQINDCTLIADKGYLSSEYQLNLFETSNIKLSVPMLKNQHNYKDQPYIFRKSRKRIETLFSQLCDQFMIRRNYAKSFNGFKTIILSKITALTVIQYINYFLFERNIQNLLTKCTTGSGYFLVTVFFYGLDFAGLILLFDEVFLKNRNKNRNK